MDIKSFISSEIDIPESIVENAVKNARRHITTFTIDKKNGGKRKIHQPSVRIKTIQYWAIRSIFEKLPVHKSSYAFKEETSILDNAIQHRENRFFLKMDLKDFFPSITYEDLRPIIKKWHKTTNPMWKFDKNAEKLIRLVCFYKNDRLPIGYPSSPIISNVVMYDFDVSVNKIISNKKYGNVQYTRYADDLVFSTNKEGACFEIKKEIENHIKNWSSPKIEVNKNKTRLGSSTSGNAQVTGLKIFTEGRISINRKYKDKIRLLLSLYKKGVLNKEEYKVLQGHLSYCHHVDPSFYTKLCKNYFLEISQIRKL